MIVKPHRRWQQKTRNRAVIAWRKHEVTDRNVKSEIAALESKFETMLDTKQAALLSMSRSRMYSTD